MDEVKIKSTFSKIMLSKFITRMLGKKFGPGIEVYINNLVIEKCNEEEKYHIEADIDGFIENRIVEDLICKKRSGSGTN